MNGTKPPQLSTSLALECLEDADLRKIYGFDHRIFRDLILMPSAEIGILISPPKIIRISSTNNYDFTCNHWDVT
jgi:hypothetical protein